MRLLNPITDESVNRRVVGAPNPFAMAEQAIVLWMFWSARSSVARR